MFKFNKVCKPKHSACTSFKFLITSNIFKRTYGTRIYLFSINEVEYVGMRQIVKIEQLATKQDNNNLKHIFIVAYILGREVLENSSG